MEMVEMTEGAKNTTEVIGSVAFMIDKYGPYIVVMAVFILSFILFTITMVHFNNKMMMASLDEKLTLLTSQNEQNEKLVDYILKEDEEEQKENNSRKEKNNKDLIGTYIDINLVIKDIMKDTLDELKAERIAIYVFHNGNKSIHGLPFFKVSCINECNKEGSEAMKTKMYRSVAHNSMPLYVLNEMIEDIYNKKEFISTNIKYRRETDGYLEAFVEHSDIESICALAIEDDNDLIGGFIIAEFNNILNLSDTKKINDIKTTLGVAKNIVKPVVTNINGEYSIYHDSN